MNIEKVALAKHKSSVDSASDKKNNGESKKQETNTENESENFLGRKGKGTLRKVHLQNKNHLLTVQVTKRTMMRAKIKRQTQRMKLKMFWERDCSSEQAIWERGFRWFT